MGIITVLRLGIHRLKWLWSLGSTLLLFLLLHTLNFSRIQRKHWVLGPSPDLLNPRSEFLRFHESSGVGLWAGAWETDDSGELEHTDKKCLAHTQSVGKPRLLQSDLESFIRYFQTPVSLPFLSNRMLWPSLTTHAQKISWVLSGIFYHPWPETILIWLLDLWGPPCLLCVVGDSQTADASSRRDYIGRSQPFQSVSSTRI